MTKRFLLLLCLLWSSFAYSEPDCNAFPVFAQDMELATPKTFLYRYFSKYPFRRVDVNSQIPAIKGLLQDHSEINRIIHIRMPLSVIFQNVNHSAVCDIYLGLIKGDYWNAAVVLPEGLSDAERNSLFANMDARFESGTNFEVACTYYVFGLSGQMRFYVAPGDTIIHASRTIVQMELSAN